MLPTAPKSQKTTEWQFYQHRRKLVTKLFTQKRDLNIWGQTLRHIFFSTSVLEKNQVACIIRQNDKAVESSGSENCSSFFI